VVSSGAADPVITAGQCNGARLTVRLTNQGSTPTHADATLTAPDALHLQRGTISTYLPAGYTRTVVLTVSSPPGTAPGTYRVRVTAGTSHLEIPVTVAPTVASPTGNLARSATRVTASSSRAGYPLCGAVDGDADSEHWGLTTGWNDVTGRQWPDWYQLHWDTHQRISQVRLHTLDSAASPAARFGLRDWDVQVTTATGWVTVAQVRGNTTGTVTSAFAALDTMDLRIVTYAANGANDYSRIVEVAAFA
jgi:hypothetical protein